MALDRYGDVLNATAPTVGDVGRRAPTSPTPEEAFDGAEAAVEAQQPLADAEQELADAQAALEEAEAGATEAPEDGATEQPTSAPLAPTASVERVEQAESEFATAQEVVTEQTPLAEASEFFNSAAVALEIAWLRLFADAGCVADEQQLQAGQP